MEVEEDLRSESKVEGIDSTAIFPAVSERPIRLESLSHDSLGMSLIMINRLFDPKLLTNNQERKIQFALKDRNFNITYQGYHVFREDSDSVYNPRLVLSAVIDYFGKLISSLDNEIGLLPTEIFANSIHAQERNQDTSSNEYLQFVSMIKSKKIIVQLVCEKNSLDSFGIQ